MSGHQYQWLAAGYDPEIGHFLEVASMVVTWWIGAFLCSVRSKPVLGSPCVCPLRIFM